MAYDLWDVETGNIINTYNSEAEALAAVRELLALNAPSYAAALSLGYEDEVGSHVIAEGSVLANHALAAVSQVAS